MRVRLTPGTSTAGGTKVFEVAGSSLDTTKGELTLTCRDGRVCLGLVGAWEVSAESSLLSPMSCDAVERIHNGDSLVLVN